MFALKLVGLQRHHNTKYP